MRIKVDDDIDRVELGGADAVAGKDSSGESALQRSEAEDAITLAPEDEPNEAVAEAANSVIEKDGVWHDWAILKTLALAEVEGCGSQVELLFLRAPAGEQVCGFRNSTYFGTKLARLTLQVLR